VLGAGSKGAEVSALQKRLGIPETGSFDQATKVAVQALQKQLGVTADGAYGPATKAAHDKSGQGGMPTTAPVVSQTAPDQVNQTQQTFNATQGVAQGRIDPNSARGQATIAQPVTPTPPGNPSGVGKNATFTPDQIAAAQEALKDPKISARDKAFYTDMIARQTVKETTGYDEVQRIVSLVHYR
jgi:peptidoglycan hydrolase-like protein with peptidoglycan-binding domain